MCSCPQEKGIKTAPPPPRLVSKGKIGFSIWTEVLLFKYANHLPLSRLLDSWEERGLSLSAGTVTGGLKKIAPIFRPLYEEDWGTEPNSLLFQGGRDPVLRCRSLTHTPVGLVERPNKTFTVI